MKNITGNVKGWTINGQGNSTQSEIVINNEPAKAIPSTEELIKKGAEFKAMLDNYYNNQYKHTKVYSGITSVEVIISELELINEPNN